VSPTGPLEQNKRSLPLLTAIAGTAPGLSTAGAQTVQA